MEFLAGNRERKIKKKKIYPRKNGGKLFLYYCDRNIKHKYQEDRFDPVCSC